MITKNFDDIIKEQENLSPDDAMMLKAFKDQLLLATVQSILKMTLGKDTGTFVIPVEQIDGTGQFTMVMTPDPESRNFELEVRKKQ